jgi:hypothetical protein
MGRDRQFWHDPTRDVGAYGHSEKRQSPGMGFEFGAADK